MPESNGNGHARTINDWLLQIDTKLDNIQTKLDAKADKDVLLRQEDKLEKLEEKHSKLAIRVGATAATVSLIITLAGWIFNS